jgi:hypothetical protein
MSDNSGMFDLTNSREFYAMLVEDFDDFMAQPHSARRAVHCAITAYHLHEWVWGDWLKEDYGVWKAIGIRDKDSFRAWIESKCVWFLAVQDIANGTKHFIRDQGFETMRIGGYGQGPFGVGPYGQGYLLIDYGEGAAEHRWQPAAPLLEVVVRFWRDFFRAYRPSLDLPVSKHHVH